MSRRKDILKSNFYKILKWQKSFLYCPKSYFFIVCFGYQHGNR